MSVFQVGVERAFAQAAVFGAIVFKASGLLIEEIVRLMDETDRDISDNLGWAGLATLSIGFIGIVWFLDGVPPQLAL